ncbi:protein argonaute 14-like [Trachypithecus francoisi]|uniref:protein argonaute 14-like n=1 Tax=Trachypithecus francoisi TaxID=54180 RepID=UPI00141AE11F|nr:protein argonaute 14-like [Trachypithecus francoisi]
MKEPRGRRRPRHDELEGAARLGGGGQRGPGSGRRRGPWKRRGSGRGTRVWGTGTPAQRPLVGLGRRLPTEWPGGLAARGAGRGRGRGRGAELAAPGRAEVGRTDAGRKGSRIPRAAPPEASRPRAAGAPALSPPRALPSLTMGMGQKEAPHCGGVRDTLSKQKIFLPAHTW